MTIPVYLSVTPVGHALTVQDFKILFAPYDRAMFLVSWGQSIWCWV